MAKRWDPERSRDLYQIDGWGQPYFAISDDGNVVVRPDGEPARQIDLKHLTSELVARGLSFPLLLRFPNILEDRIRMLNVAFQKAIREYDYEGVYRGVFPIKVNQQRHIVEDIVDYGRPWGFGLEAGSKGELLIALAAMRGPNGFIVCNGYKDSLFMETALMAQKFDNTVLIVLERFEELEVLLRASAKLGIRPRLGVRSKLSSKGMGRWADSTGDRAKFGLTTSEIVAVVDRLKKEKMLDCLQLLHFHIGSQISSIIPWKNALREAGHLYVELCRLGCEMQFFDVGGGLAVDYDGSKTDFHASMNYGVQEYAYDVVAGIQDACRKADLPCPTIISESGRAVVAHQSLLVFEAMGAADPIETNPTEPSGDCHRVNRELYQTWSDIKPKNVQEAFHDATQALEEARSLFKFGYLGLRDLALTERLFRACCEKIKSKIKRKKHVPEELQNIEEKLGTIYFCNFSLFQSAPDIWAMDQLFPIMPIHRLAEKPTVKARLADLTCDSDGIVDSFINVDEVQTSLDVHELKEDESYLLGMFLVGAYQEVLGDLHNLFGDTHAVHVRMEDSGYSVGGVVCGDSIEKVLGYLQHDSEAMLDGIRAQAEQSLARGEIDLEQLRTFINHYESALRSYTYFQLDR